MILAAAILAQTILGTWTGTSKCTNVRPACHDEVALYRIAPAAKSRVNMSMAKIVDGKEVVMGTLVYNVDSERQLLTSEFKSGDMHFLWTFHWEGTHMTGTLQQLPKKQIIRNITLERSSAKH